MSTLEFFQKRFDLNLNQRKMPIEIPNFGRDQLADVLNELDFRIGVEVGVASGEYSAVLARANPQMKLFGIDPYVPHNDYKDYTSMRTFETLRNGAIKKLNSRKNYEFIEKFSMDAVKEFGDETLDFVYIDANHDFVNVTNDIYEWSKKVKPGGIIAGHDYLFSSNNHTIHVKNVLPAYTAAYKIKPWFVLGREANDEGLIRDRPRSWMIIK